MAHLDEIGVLECDFALYYFLDEGLLKLQLAEDLRSKYIVGRLLGQGASASVKEGFTRVGHKRRAIKIIDKEREQYNDTEDLDLMREVDIFGESSILALLRSLRPLKLMRMSPLSWSTPLEAISLGSFRKTMSLATWSSTQG